MLTGKQFRGGALNGDSRTLARLIPILKECPYKTPYTFLRIWPPGRSEGAVKASDGHNGESGRWQLDIRRRRGNQDLTARVLASRNVVRMSRIQADNRSFWQQASISQLRRSSAAGNADAVGGDCGMISASLGRSARA